MTNLSQGWSAYHRGNYDEALRHFEAGSGETAAAGQAIALLAMGRSRQATAVAQQAFKDTPSRFLSALVADILGRQGQRADAERVLTGAASQGNLKGFYRSLLGEQRLRQGNWNAGTEDFIAAIKSRDKRTFPHVKRVVADMVDAVAARRIPGPDAAKFVNRLDYSASDKPQEINLFFASARRAINDTRRMKRNNLIEPWAVGVKDRAPAPSDAPAQSQSSPPNRGPQTSGPSRSKPPKPPSRADRRRRQQQKKRRASSPNQERAPQPPAAREKQKNRREIRDRLAQRVEVGGSGPDEMSMQANRKNLAQFMNQARKSNETLQNLVSPMPPPKWPSEHKNSIDIIEPIGFSKDSILPGSSAINTANFRITGGDIGVEVLLERCMHNVIAAAQAKYPTTLPLDVPSIARIELNLLDGFLADMPDLDRTFDREHDVDDPQALGLGKFIGECIVQSYGGVWQHHEPPQESVIHLGDHELDPIGMATRFLDSDDPDAVSLRDLVHEAQEAVYTSTAMPNFTTHIDPTSGLDGEGLLMSLGEAWVNYRFGLEDTFGTRVARSINLEATTPNFIAFTMDHQYTPPALPRRIDGALNEEGAIAMAYLRRSGEFLLLPSRKHFCRLLEAASLTMTNDTVPTIAEMADRYFRPTWDVITTRDDLGAIRKRSGQGDLQPPGLRQRNGITDLRLHAIDRSGQARIIQISWHKGATNAYRMAIR